MIFCFCSKIDGLQGVFLASLESHTERERDVLCFILFSVLFIAVEGAKGILVFSAQRAIFMSHVHVIMMECELCDMSVNYLFCVK